MASTGGGSSLLMRDCVIVIFIHVALWCVSRTIRICEKIIMWYGSHRIHNAECGRSGNSCENGWLCPYDIRTFSFYFYSFLLVSYFLYTLYIWSSKMSATSYTSMSSSSSHWTGADCTHTMPHKYLLYTRMYDHTQIGYRFYECIAHFHHESHH